MLSVEEAKKILNDPNITEQRAKKFLEFLYSSANEILNEYENEQQTKQ